MLPLALVSSARRSPILVEVKSGETFNGTLLNCDVWMNLHLSDVIQTSSDGDRFWRLPEAFIRGSTIKYVRLSEEIVDSAKETNRKMQQSRRLGGSRGRGDRNRESSRGSRGGRR